MPNFDIENYINNYAKQAAKQTFKTQALGINNASYTDLAILAFWDKNIDGVVTKEEFYDKSKEDYQSYMNSLFDLYKKKPEFNKNENKNEITEYSDIEKLYDKKGYFGIFELWFNSDNRLNNTQPNMPEQKHKEFYSYEGEFTDRQYSNTQDENSDCVDWHVGTFTQGLNGTCTLLSATEFLETSDLKSLYTLKTDNEGKNYYEVNFPKDNGKKPIIVTEQELKNGYLTKGKNIITGFSMGDADVLLLEMAYTKRYGVGILKKGETPVKVLNRLFKNRSAKSHTIIQEEMLLNNKPSLTVVYDIALFKIKNIDNNNYIVYSKDEKYLIKQVFGAYGIELPDGKFIMDNHTYAVKNYDPKTKEVTLINPNENSTDIKIPFDIFQKLFCIYQ